MDNVLVSLDLLAQSAMVVPLVILEAPAMNVSLAILAIPIVKVCFLHFRSMGANFKTLYG